MNILIAPDSFKGTLTAAEVCDILESAIKSKIKDCEIKKLPVADGGEGLCACLFKSIGGEKIKVNTKGPFNEDIEAEYIMLDNNMAVIEMASCAGLPLAGENANPLYTTTYGVGIMILDACKRNCKKIVLGLGGSATNDCGIGMASALGYKFVDKDGKNVNPIGENLILIDKIIPTDKKLDADFVAACDVNNPLYGLNGAAYVFSPQKGADEKAVKLLDDGLKNIASIIQRDICIDVSDIVGAGAAGGLGAGAVSFLGARLKSGIDIVLDTVNFDEALSHADLVITGEGKLDNQSEQGKVISGVCKRANNKKVPVFAACGCADKDVDLHKLGIKELCISLKAQKELEEIKKTSHTDLYLCGLEISEKILQFFKEKA